MNIQYDIRRILYLVDKPEPFRLEYPEFSVLYFATIKAWKKDAEHILSALVNKTVLLNTVVKFMGRNVTMKKIAKIMFMGLKTRQFSSGVMADIGDILIDRYQRDIEDLGGFQIAVHGKNADDIFFNLIAITALHMKQYK